VSNEHEPSPSEILRALQEALSKDSRLKRSSIEEVAKELSLGGYLQVKPSLLLVADMLEVMKMGGLGLRSPTLQPCSVEVFWDADAGRISSSVALGLNLDWRGAPALWDELPGPEKVTHIKSSPCTDLISDTGAVLRDKERWPTHLCEAEFMAQSTGLWAEAQPFVVDSVNIHRWATIYPLPIGRRALLDDHEMDDIVEWSEVLHALPFGGDERAMWALTVEHREGTVVCTLDLFGLAEYPTEKHRTLDLPVAGDLAFSVRGKGRFRADELLGSAERWWGQFRGLTLRGRPPGSGAWANREEFENALRQAVTKVRSEGTKVTQESVAQHLYTNDRQLRAWIEHFRANWLEIRNG
jgi:hypothetical protein